MPSELTIATLIQERHVLYQLKQELGILKGDLEILAFAYSNMFFSLYDLKKHYNHTNIQQLSRSLQKLSKNYYLHVFKKGSKGSPTQYTITPDGERLLNRYQAGVIPCDKAEIHLRSAAGALMRDNSLRDIIRYRNQ